MVLFSVRNLCSFTSRFMPESVYFRYSLDWLWLAVGLVSKENYLPPHTVEPPVVADILGTW